MFRINYFMPTEIILTEGALESLGEKLLRWGQRVLIITGKKSAIDSGLLDRIGGILNKRGITYEIYSGVRSNPTQDCIADAATLAKDSATEVVLTVGGGSVHDAGKLVSLLVTHGGTLSDYAVDTEGGIGRILPKLLTVACVPTISGTGSEISPAALATIENKKRIIFSFNLYPRLALIDTSVIFSHSPRLNALVAFDSFVQGLEALVATNANPLSDMFAIEAIRNCVKYLPDLVRDSSSFTARSFVALASIQSLLAVAQSGVGAIHALSDPLSGRYDIHHGTALAMLASSVVKANHHANPKKLAQVRSLLSREERLSQIPCTSEELALSVEKFLDELKVGSLPRLSDLGVSESDINVLVAESRNPDMSTNPQTLSDKEIRAIFMEIL